MESRKRSLFKAFSWRGIALTITALVTYLYSGDWRAAAAIGLGDSAIKILAYYLHERAWQATDIGLARPDAPTPDVSSPAKHPSPLPATGEPKTC